MTAKKSLLERRLLSFRCMQSPKVKARFLLDCYEISINYNQCQVKNFAA
jgi:hypothetical protein